MRHVDVFSGKVLVFHVRTRRFYLTFGPQTGCSVGSSCMRPSGLVLISYVRQFFVRDGFTMCCCLEVASRR